jgi:metal-responsive CopG/Arc/MetJ family transcriptional regulator
MLVGDHQSATLRVVRTTVTLDEDVSAELDRIRRERGIGVSEAVNDLIRAGLRVREGKSKFRQRSRAMGLRMDVTNVADTLELLEGPTHR